MKVLNLKDFIVNDEDEALQCINTFMEYRIGAKNISNIKIRSDKEGRIVSAFIQCNFKSERRFWELRCIYKVEENSDDKESVNLSTEC